MRGSLKTLVAVVALSALILGWYWFRPEKSFLDRRVDEPHPIDAQGARLLPLAEGSFQSVAHETFGMARVYRPDNGERLLRLDDFATSDGPEVHVYLVAAPDAPNNEIVMSAGFVTLGPLKGNIGNQSYVIPGSIDLNRYQCVTIWCKRFGVNFGRAPLVLSE